ncbi:MAG: hypothetical protein HOW73_47875 [Polyangiaceae bacterium]|nr:hypothetical protein [Polyangiaceae bacterium]
MTTQTTSTFKIPGGNNRGTLLHAADDKTLRYWFDRIGNDLAADPGRKWADKDRQWLGDAKKILVERGVNADELPIPNGSGNGGGGASQPRAASNGATQRGQNGAANGAALARRQDAQVVGSFKNAQAINQQLENAASLYHLVSPATSCGSISMGCEVALSLVQVDPSTEKGGPGEVYPLPGGKLGLSGTTLKKIAAAAGVSWDPQKSGRLDDGREPNYCHYRAVGWVRNFDGSMRCLSGEIELDLRDDSPQYDAMKARARDEANFTSQIRDMRLFLIRHAETKAKLRAITDMGIKRSYTAAELTKPFAVASLMFTGHSDNPEIQKMFAEKIGDAYTASIRGLFGAPAAQAPALPASPAPFVGHSTPPVGAVGADDDFIDMPAPAPTPRPAAQASPPAQQPASDDEELEDPYADEPNRGDDPNRY